VAIATIVDNASASFSILTGRPVPERGTGGGLAQVIPSIVHASGRSSFFETELSLTNATQDPALLTLSYLFGGTDESGAPVTGTVQRTFSLGPRESLPAGLGRDTVVSFFSRPTASNTSGSLRVEGPGAGHVVARATVSTPLDLGKPARGTMSAELQAELTTSPRVAGKTSSAAVVCSGLRKWDRERVNLILTEVTGQPARVRVRAATYGGGLLAESEYVVAPHQKLQVNDVWSGEGGLGLGDAPLEGLLLSLEAVGTETGKVLGVLTVIDNLTSSSRNLRFDPPGPPPRV
jgi:hypothetical protein